MDSTIHFIRVSYYFCLLVHERFKTIIVNINNALVTFWNFIQNKDLCIIYLEILRNNPRYLRVNRTEEKLSFFDREFYKSLM